MNAANRGKTTDPKLVQLLDQLAKEEVRGERAYARMRRAFRAVERSRAICRRLSNRVAARREQLADEQRARRQQRQEGGG